MFSKSNWHKTTLGNLFTKIEENDRENAHKRFDRFLPVVHMEPESLHINKWSSQSKGDEINPYFYKIFRRGQILFPTRNPHLRRTVLASFDGICGEKTLTLEPKPNLIVPDFAPFLFHSNSFYEHTTSSIIGSTNPHCRWRDVAEYEFLLPPITQQTEIAELLWAVDKIIENDTSLLNSSEIFLNSKIEQSVHGLSLEGKTINEILGELSQKIELITVGECGEVFKGKGIQKADVVSNGIPCVRYGELYTKHHRVIRSCNTFIDNKQKAKAFRLMKNDVLFAGSGETITEIGKSAAFISETETYAGSDILILRPEKMDGTFLGYLMNSQLVRQQLNKLGTGSSVMHIYKNDIEKIKIPKLSYDLQVAKSKELEEIENNIKLIREKVEASKGLQKSLINQVY